MATIRRLYKQGNSVVLSVPGWLLEYNGLEVGDDVVMESKGQDGIVQFRKWNPPDKPDETRIKDKDRQHLAG